MKRSLIALFLVTCILGSASAKDWATSMGSCFKKGDMYFGGGMSVYHFGFYALFDYAVHDAISIGGGSGYNGYGHNMYWRYNYVPLSFRGDFHPFNLSALADKIKVRDKLDPYAGLSSGWRFGWARWDGDGEKFSEPAVGGFFFRENIGVRYYVNPKFFLNAEEEAGFGLFNFGVGVKF